MWRILPTYRSVTAQMSSWPQGLSTVFGGLIRRMLARARGGRQVTEIPLERARPGHRAVAGRAHELVGREHAVPRPRRRVPGAVGGARTELGREARRPEDLGGEIEPG